MKTIDEAGFYVTIESESRGGHYEVAGDITDDEDRMKAIATCVKEYVMDKENNPDMELPKTIVYSATKITRVDPVDVYTFMDTKNKEKQNEADQE